MTFGFGLAYGFGFAFALRPALQFAGTHQLTSVLSFNLGIELALLLVLALLVPALNLLFRFAVSERLGTIILSALIAHTAWHATGERWDAAATVHVRVAADRRVVSRRRRCAGRCCWWPRRRCTGWSSDYCEPPRKSEV